jgi:hypothetical protein
MSASLDRNITEFEAHRRALTGLAYRMLGSRAEAEDVVQDAYLRWHAADHAAIGEPRRYLGTHDAVLPGQYAGPLHRLQGLCDRATGALSPVGDRLIAREARPGAGVVESPQQRLQALQEGAGDRTLVLAPLAVSDARLKLVGPRANHLGCALIKALPAIAIGSSGLF